MKHKYFNPSDITVNLLRLFQCVDDLLKPAELPLGEYKSKSFCIIELELDLLEVCFDV